MSTLTVIIYVLLSLLILAGALAVKNRLEAAGFYYPAPIGAFGVVLVARSFITKLDPHPGLLLIRSYTGGDELFLWTMFLILLAAIAVMQFSYDRVPLALRGDAGMGLLRWLGGIFFVWALVVPMNWLSPLMSAAFLILALVVALVFFRSARRTGSRAMYVMAILAAVFFLFGFLSTSSTFWKRDVPRDFAQKLCSIPVISGSDSCQQARRQAFGPQVKPEIVQYSAVIKDGRAKVTATCASAEVCHNKVRPSRVYAQSLANQYKVPATLQMVAGGKKVGSPIVLKPLHVKSDAQYGAVSNDPCTLPNGKLGAELPDPKTNELACRTLVGHTGRNY